VRSEPVYEGEFAFDPDKTVLGNVTVPTFVYQLTVDSEVVYVGQTAYLASRLAAHKWMRFTRVKVELYSTRSDAESREAQLIWDLNPKFNIQGRPIGWKAACIENNPSYRARQLTNA
jgi:hypothetical protein